MLSDRGMNTFQGVAAVNSFVTNLPPFRPRQGVGSWWFLVNNFEESGFIGKRFMSGRSSLNRGGIPLVYLDLQTFILPRDASAADRRTGHQVARSEPHTSGRVPFNSNGPQLPLRQPPEWHVPDERRPLDVGILSLVSRWLDIPLPSVQVHSGAFTNRLLSSYHADAMTIGRDIYLKTGKFDLRSASGLALLTHELTHVSQQLPGSGGAVNAPPSRQEQIAIENERLVLLHARAHFGPQNAPLMSYALGSISASPPLGLWGSPTLPPAPGAMPASPPLGLWGSPTLPPGPALAPEASHHMEARAVTPMFADTSRSTAVPEPMPPAPPTPVGLSDHDMERIKAEVYQDLMRQLKEQLERGA
jgi:Domain of unknown function (DUF4157)